MIGARHSADYYLDEYRHIGHHIAFAQEAQRAYTEADERLRGYGVEDNELRQSIIHAVHESVVSEGWWRVQGP